MPATVEKQYESEVQKIEFALNLRDGKFIVKLSNVGNPDYRQDCTKPLPDTTCGLAKVESLKEAVELCRLYIRFYDLGGGNWNGGQIVRDDGLVIGRVSYNGRIWEDGPWTPSTKEIIP